MVMNPMVRSIKITSNKSKWSHYWLSLEFPLTEVMPPKIRPEISENQTDLRFCETEKIWILFLVIRMIRICPRKSSETMSMSETWMYGVANFETHAKSTALK